MNGYILFHSWPTASYSFLKYFSKSILSSNPFIYGQNAVTKTPPIIPISNSIVVNDNDDFFCLSIMSVSILF